MSHSKHTMIDSFIRRIVDDSINEAIADSPASADALRGVKGRVLAAAAYRATRPYTMIELNDITHWKKPKSID